MQTATVVAPNADKADFSTFQGLAVTSDGSVMAFNTGVPGVNASGGVARSVFVY